MNTDPISKRFEFAPAGRRKRSETKDVAEMSDTNFRNLAAYRQMVLWYNDVGRIQTHFPLSNAMHGQSITHENGIEREKRKWQ